MGTQAKSNSFMNGLARFLCRPWLAIAWLVVILLCGLWTALSLSRGYTFDSSILALLPTSQDHQSPGRQSQGLQSQGLQSLERPSVELATYVDQQLADLAGQRMVFLVSHEDRQQSARAATELAKALSASPAFSRVHAGIGQRQAANWREAFFPYRYNLLTPEARAQLRGAGVEKQHPLLQQALARLYSPMASAVGPTLIDDPLQLFFNWQIEAAPQTPFSVENGWLTRTYQDRTYRLIAVSLEGNPYDLGFQEEVNTVLGRAEASLPEGSELLGSGLLIHAAHGAAQARQEISTIGVGSLLGIALLLIYCFRRLRYVLLAFLPIVSGWLFALAISMALFEGLHLVTLAFGASLIGVAIDYSLHYLCAAQEHDASSRPTANPKQTTLLRIMPGISLGLVSSILAYAAQGAAPFPGLRQMAVFSVCGLFAAWLTVAVWLPWLAPREIQTNIPIHRLAHMLARLLARWPNVASPPVAGAILILLLACLVQLGQLDFDDDVRRLQTSPPELLQEDAAVQSLTRSVNPSQYFLVSADSKQKLLEIEEALRPDLEGLMDSGQLYDFQAVSKWVPSKAMQEANRALNADMVYSDDGLASLLARAIGSPPLVAQMQARFEENPEPKLTVEDWLGSELGENQRFLWLGGFEQQFHSLILLAEVRDQQTLQELSGFAASREGLHFVDKVAAITMVLKTHRQQLLSWILLAYGAVLLLLTRRYGRNAWRILAAPAIASLLTLAILSWGGFPVNIFNLLALLLVLGIGLDAGLFLRESVLRESALRESACRYTWTAVSLAACTTLLAFGLLSLSKTPVLHQFGITVLLGIVGVWCLAPCFVWNDLESNNENFSGSEI